jgi:23S rRNA (pseudouridine1915-N3)-methyltransferase
MPEGSWALFCFKKICNYANLRKRGEIPYPRDGIPGTKNKELRQTAMKITLLLTGKTEESWLRKGMSGYEERIRKYLPFGIEELPGLKNTSGLTRREWKKREAEAIARRLLPADYLVLLAEKGEEMTSTEFSAFLNKRFSQGLKNLVFAVGGPYGFDDSLEKRAAFRLSLSRMTFPHQLVRILFLEQLYRALTILRNEPYHHE